MNKIKAVIFDLYGTLIYLEHETRPYIKLLKEFKKDISVKEARKTFLTKDFSSLLELIKDIDADLQIDLSYYEQEITKELETAKLYSESLDVLEKLREKGIKIAVISNLASPYKKSFFKLGLDKLVDKYIFSCEVGIKKPEKSIYKLIVKEFGYLPNEILMVGDSIYCDYYGPKSLNINALLLDRKKKHSSLERIFLLTDIFHLEHIIL